MSSEPSVNFDYDGDLEDLIKWASSHKVMFASKGAYCLFCQQVSTLGNIGADSSGYFCKLCSKRTIVGYGSLPTSDADFMTMVKEYLEE